MPVSNGTAVKDHSAEVLSFPGTVAANRCERQTALGRILRLAVDHVPHAVLVFGRTGEVLSANRRAEAVFAFGVGQLVGQPIGRLVPEASSDVCPDPWRSFWTNPQNRMLGVDRPVTGTRSDGTTVPLEIALNVLVDGEMPYVVASVTEVSERQRLEARLAATTSDLQDARSELQQLRESAADETQQSRAAVKVFRTSHLIVSESEPVQRALAQVEQVAATPSTVLLFGETGAGKEIFAKAIHELSARRQREMIRVSCAAMPSTLIESELFGRERGAYTGALSRQMGRFEAAHQSTLFLDEIGELSAEVQIKLLRVLQERVIERLGSTQQIKVDVRIIAATNRNLEKAVEDKTFREDLYYRLNVFPIVVPPLRERVEDIPGLVWEFVSEFSKSFGKPIESVAKESMRQLQLYSWPGNVRELRNVIERAVILADGPRLTVSIPQPVAGRQLQSSLTLRNLEIEHIRTALETTKWRIRGPLGAAERLGLKPTTLETRMARLGLIRPKAL
jgi:formate hydrogenlyase transcriptional activator